LSRKKLNLLKNLQTKGNRQRIACISHFWRISREKKEEVEASDFLPMEPFFEKFLDKALGV